MKRALIIIFSLIFLLFLLLYISGLETRYSYNNVTGPERIELLKSDDFNLQLHAIPDDSTLNVNVVFKNLEKTVFLESAQVIIYSEDLRLNEVSASDGFYNWVEEKNGNAKTFDELPKHLKIVDKDIEAYFVYNWSFDTMLQTPKSIEIKLIMSLIVEGKKIQINKIVKLELKMKVVFRSPIRFH